MPPETPTSTSMLLLQSLSPCPTPDIHRSSNVFGHVGDEDSGSLSLPSSHVLGILNGYFGFQNRI